VYNTLKSATTASFQIYHSW